LHINSVIGFVNVIDAGLTTSLVDMSH